MTRNRPLVLIVDDDAMALSMLVGVLAGESRIRVEVAHDGSEGLQRALELVPDLVISDLRMPGFDGFEFCQRLKADVRTARSMFLLLTAHGEADLKVHGLALGMDDYVTKPVHGGELLARIRTLLRIKQLHDELRQDKDELERLHEEATSNVARLLELLVHLIDSRRPGARARGDRLTALSRELAERMQVPGEFREDLLLAARLHEIGHVCESSDGSQGDGAPPWRHLLLARAVLRDVDRLSAAGDLLGGLLENWDGTGGPARLRQGEIPLRSRLLRVGFDYLTAVDRGLSPALARSALEPKSGTWYDPVVLAHLDGLLAATGEELWSSERRRCLPVGTLAAGMVLAEDLLTSSGAKLLSQGAVISPGALQAILRRHQADPIIYGVWVETGPRGPVSREV